MKQDFMSLFDESPRCCIAWPIRAAGYKIRLMFVSAGVATNPSDRNNTTAKPARSASSPSTRKPQRSLSPTKFARSSKPPTSTTPHPSCVSCGFARSPRKRAIAQKPSTGSPTRDTPPRLPAFRPHPPVGKRTGVDPRPGARPRMRGMMPDEVSDVNHRVAEASSRIHPAKVVHDVI
jgi:hypothetical protein